VQLAWRAARSVAPRGPAGLIDAVHGKRVLGKVDTNEDNGQTSVHSELMSKPQLQYWVSAAVRLETS
jgi:hypothetical protein